MYDYLVGDLDHFLLFHLLGMSSSQLTKSIIFQRGRYTTNQLWVWWNFFRYPQTWWLRTLYLQSSGRSAGAVPLRWGGNSMDWIHWMGGPCHRVETKSTNCTAQAAQGRVRNEDTTTESPEVLPIWLIVTGHVSNNKNDLVGGFKHFLFSIIYGIILPID